MLREAPLFNLDPSIAAKHEPRFKQATNKYLTTVPYSRDLLYNRLDLMKQKHLARLKLIAEETP